MYKQLDAVHLIAYTLSWLQNTYQQLNNCNSKLDTKSSTYLNLKEILYRILSQFILNTTFYWYSCHIINTNMVSLKCQMSDFVIHIDNCYSQYVPNKLLTFITCAKSDKWISCRFYYPRLSFKLRRENVTFPDYGNGPKRDICVNRFTRTDSRKNKCTVLRL